LTLAVSTGWGKYATSCMLLNFGFPYDYSLTSKSMNAFHLI